MRRRIALSMLLVLVFVLSLGFSACGSGQLVGTAFTPTPIPPTSTPTPVPPTPTPTPIPITVDDLSAAALKSTDLPSGFSPLSGDELQGMQDLTSIVTQNFPNAQVAGFTAYGKKLDSGKYDAVVVSFYFYPLSPQDITVFDNPHLASKTFAHGAGRVECIDCGSGKYIGNYSANLSLLTQNFIIDEVVARTDNIGFAAMVLSNGQSFKLDLATTVAEALNNNIQMILGK